MGTASFSIAVIGCGIGGQAAALFLSRAGHRVTIFEEFAEPKAVGAGLLLQPTGQTILAKLGLLDQIRSAGAAVSRLHGKTSRGREVLDLSYTDENENWHGIGIHRGVLFSALHDQIIASDVDVKTDCGIAHIHQQPDKVEVESCHGVKETFDLVVVAEGGSPTLLPNEWINWSAVPYPWGALWSLCPDPEHRFPSTLAQIYEGASVMIGILPIGTNPTDTSDTPHVSFFWSLQTDKMREWQARSLDDWKTEVRSYWPDADYLLSTISAHDQLLTASYRDIVMWPWNVGRVVYIGDAAHCTSPQLGQGANLALIDAHTLAETLCEGEGGTHGIPRRLSTYSRRRCSHIAYYQIASRLLTPFFQSSGTILPFLRDQAMHTFCRFPLTRSIMVRTLAGVHEGFFGTLRL